MSLKLDLKQYQLENNTGDLDLAQKYRRGLFHIFTPYILALMTFLPILSPPYILDLNHWTHTRFRKLFKKKFTNDGDDKDDPIMVNTDESTQASLRLMDEIRKSRLFTMPTTGDFMKLTQRDTNLCVAIAAMRLLCFTLDAFLRDSNIFRQDVNKQKIESILKEIINLPEVPKKNDGQNKQQIPGNFFIMYMTIIYL